MIILLPLAVMLVGVVMYLFCTKAEWKEIGKIAYMDALLVVLLLLSTKYIELLIKELR